jgi:hypothetical protein
MKKETFQIIVFLIAALLFCFAGKAQDKWYKPGKNDIYSYGLMAASGVAKGYNQAVMHHYYKRGDQFWDKEISWQNKYKDWPSDQSAAFIGSKGILSFATDGQHLTQMLNTTFLIGGTGLLAWNMKSELKQIPKGQRWLYILLWKVIVPFGIRTASFELTFKNL